MGRGPVIAQKKEASAKAKAKVNTLHAKLISLAAERGTDPSQNNALADAIHAAKKDGVTIDVIDRAVKRGGGLDKDSERVEEILYEGYAPGGVALIVRALTDNRNRTAPNMRHIFSAYGGNLGETGTVSNFAFDYRGVITIRDITDPNLIEAAIMETSAEDYILDLDAQTATVITDPTHLSDVRRELESRGFTVTKAIFEYIPKNSLEITDEDNILKLYKMLEAFADDEDVEMTWNNADIADILWQKTAEKVEASRFHT